MEVINETLLKKNSRNLFHNYCGNNGYLNYYELFLLYFNSIPNSIEEINIDCEKANIHFFNIYRDDVKENFYQKEIFGNEVKPKFKQVYYILDKIIVIFYMEYNCVQFLFLNKNVFKVESIIDEVLKFKKRKEKTQPEISLLIKTHRGMGTASLKITKPKLKIEDNYNDDFQIIHQIIYKRLLTHVTQKHNKKS